jgi:D-3-phosphoglycerate dehydrogenase
MISRILVTDKVHPLLIDGLVHELGCEVDYDTSVDNHRLDDIICHYAGIIINSKILMTPERIDRGKNLRFIGRLGSGMEIIDVEYAKKKGIGVYNSPEGNRNAVAEHSFGMLLCLLHKICLADVEVRNFHWDREKHRGVELKGKTVGIIGLGHTGTSFAEKFEGWGVRVLAFDKYREQFPDHISFVERVELETILKECDIISLHLPLTSETSQWVDSTWLKKCRPGCILINTSRGSIVNTRDVIQALQTGHLLGACLDVFENEKPESFSASEKEMYALLYDFKNVILTPHVAGWTYESLEGIAKILLEKIKNGRHFA